MQREQFSTNGRPVRPTAFCLRAALPALLAGLLLVPAGLTANAPPQVRAVVAKMASLRVFRANVRFGTGGGMTSGVLSFQHGKTHFKLGDGRVMAGNGRYLTVYSPATGVAGKQTMGLGGGGLGWVLSGFDYRVAGNQAVGKATNPDAKVQEVRIRWGAGNMLRQLSVKHKGSDSWFTIAISNVRTVGGFPASLFSYKPPAGSRTVENPMDQRN